MPGHHMLFIGRELSPEESSLGMCFVGASWLLYHHMGLCVCSRNTAQNLLLRTVQWRNRGHIHNMSQIRSCQLHF